MTFVDALKFWAADLAVKLAFTFLFCLITFLVFLLLSRKKK